MLLCRPSVMNQPMWLVATRESSCSTGRAALLGGTFRFSQLRDALRCHYSVKTPVAVVIPSGDLVLALASAHAVVGVTMEQLAARLLPFLSYCLLRTTPSLVSLALVSC